MKKKEKKKIFELYSDNNKVNNLIEKMKSNSKAYSKLKTALELLDKYILNKIVVVTFLFSFEIRGKIRLDNFFMCYFVLFDVI